MKKGDGACGHRLCGFVGEYSYRDIGERVHDWTVGLPRDQQKLWLPHAVSNAGLGNHITSPQRANSIVRRLKKGSECF